MLSLKYVVDVCFPVIKVVVTSLNFKTIFHQVNSNKVGERSYVDDVKCSTNSPLKELRQKVEFQVAENDLARFRKAYVRSNENPGVSYNMPEIFNTEGYFGE